VGRVVVSNGKQGQVLWVGSAIMPRMDSTASEQDPIERVKDLLAQAIGLDPAEAVEPLAQAAELLESLLDAEDEI
jgi:hypothetical protein